MTFCRAWKVVTQSNLLDSRAHHLRVPVCVHRAVRLDDCLHNLSLNPGIQQRLTNVRRCDIEDVVLYVVVKNKEALVALVGVEPTKHSF